MSNAIRIGLPGSQIDVNDQTGVYPSNKYTVDDYNGNGQPSFLNALDRIPYLNVRLAFEMEDGSTNDNLTTFTLSPSIAEQAPAAARNADLIATAWVLDICDPALGVSVRGEVLNWQYAVAFTDPTKFNDQVPAGVRNSLWIDPEGVLPDRQKYWWEMSQANSDIGYWLPDDIDPTVAQQIAWPCWFTDGVPLTGRNAADFKELAGITIQSRENFASATGLEVITQDDLDRWGYVLP